MDHKKIDEALWLFLRRHQRAIAQWRAAFFDMDGVLFDSMPAHARAWREATEGFGIDMSEQDAYLFEGQTGHFTINLLTERQWGRPATEEEKRKIYERKTALFVLYNDGASIPHADRALEACASLERVLVTGSSQSTLLDKVNRAYPDVFSAQRMITGRDVRFGKPDPEPYLMAMQVAGSEPWQSIVLENAPMGVRSAHKAGAFVLAVNTGPLPEAMLREEGADLVVSDMLEAQAALKHLLRDE